MCLIWPKYKNNNFELTDGPAVTVEKIILDVTKE